jgi:predicted metal-dependent peptidase
MCRKNLARFLNEVVSAARGYQTLWTVPNRKLLAVYPQVILPTYETKYWWDILMAIDTSGSVPNQFISIALAFARQRVPRTQITVISFDTVCYGSPPSATTLKGGGGTRAQAVEDYIHVRMKHYPHYVFLLTDGWTPQPSPQHPERWIWLLPPWGSTEAVPKGSRAEFFAADEVSARSMLAT